MRDIGITSHYKSLFVCNWGSINRLHEEARSISMPSLQVIVLIDGISHGRPVQVVSLDPSYEFCNYAKRNIAIGFWFACFLDRFLGLESSLFLSLDQPQKAPSYFNH